MMESYAAFYGVDNDNKVKKLAYSKLQAASRDTGKLQGAMTSVPAAMQNDPNFKQASKKFFQNEVSDTASQYNINAGKFFDGGAQGKITAENTVGDKFQGVQDRIVPGNMDGERYNKDNAAFFGEDAELRSQGSAYQANQAVFFGGEKKTGGFKITANAGVTQNGPAVNTNSGVYRKDAAAFYGNDKFEVESQGTQF